jgi:hypothetical protein
MDRARIHEGIRRMRFLDVLGRVERSALGHEEAAEPLGVCEWTFRRWRDRHREEGESGLLDLRLQPSPRRAPVAEIERMLGLYRELYRGFTVKHFPRAVGQAAQLYAGLHSDEGASASSGSGDACEDVVGASKEAATAPDGGHDAASGRLDACLAAGGARQAGSGGDDGGCHQRVVFGLPGGRGRHGLEPARGAGGGGAAWSVLLALHRPRQPLL